MKKARSLRPPQEIAAVFFCLFSSSFVFCTGRIAVYKRAVSMVNCICTGDAGILRELSRPVIPVRGFMYMIVV